MTKRTLSIRWRLAESPSPPNLFKICINFDGEQYNDGKIRVSSSRKRVTVVPGGAHTAGVLANGGPVILISRVEAKYYERMVGVYLEGLHTIGRPAVCRRV